MRLKSIGLWRAVQTCKLLGERQGEPSQALLVRTPPLLHQRRGKRHSFGAVPSGAITTHSQVPPPNRKTARSNRAGVTLHVGRIGTCPLNCRHHGSRPAARPSCALRGHRRLARLACGDPALGRPRCAFSVACRCLRRCVGVACAPGLGTAGCRRHLRGLWPVLADDTWQHAPWAHHRVATGTWSWHGTDIDEGAVRRSRSPHRRGATDIEGLSGQSGRRGAVPRPWLRCQRRSIHARTAVYGPTHSLSGKGKGSALPLHITCTRCCKRTRQSGAVPIGCLGAPS